MIKIRLAKHGAKGNTFYRVVAVDEKRKREGEALDIIGYWHPSTNNKKIDKKKMDTWTSKGAVISVGVSKLLKD